jgi:tRNA/tmRNA/rRNA uracil-C5-methylase (TrmA/RlmC/RlmD family)
VVPIDRCLIAHPALDESGVLHRRWRGHESIVVVAGADGQPLVLVDGRAEGGRPGRRPAVTELALGRKWRVSGTGFWQVHPAAAETLARAVVRLLRPHPGEHALDLYSGVGLFSAALAAAVEPSGSVVAVEASASAIGDARRNLHDLPTVRLVEADVEEWLRRPDQPHADVVVLDPPRSGARRQVVARIAALRPRAIAYVACDPAALARDLAYFMDAGYAVAELEAYDLFPMTHHVEVVAGLVIS